MISAPHRHAPHVVSALILLAQWLQLASGIHDASDDATDLGGDIFGLYPPKPDAETIDTSREYLGRPLQNEDIERIMLNPKFFKARKLKTAKWKETSVKQKIEIHVRELKAAQEELELRDKEKEQARQKEQDAHTVQYYIGLNTKALERVALLREEQERVAIALARAQYTGDIDRLKNETKNATKEMYHEIITVQGAGADVMAADADKITLRMKDQYAARLHQMDEVTHLKKSQRLLKVAEATGNYSAEEEIVKRAHQKVIDATNAVQTETLELQSLHDHIRHLKKKSAVSKIKENNLREKSMRLGVMAKTMQQDRVHTRMKAAVRVGNINYQLNNTLDQERAVKRKIHYYKNQESADSDVEGRVKMQTKEVEAKVKELEKAGEIEDDELEVNHARGLNHAKALDPTEQASIFDSDMGNAIQFVLKAAKALAKDRGEFKFFVEQSHHLLDTSGSRPSAEDSEPLGVDHQHALQQQHVHALHQQHMHALQQSNATLQNVTVSSATHTEIAVNALDRVSVLKKKLKKRKEVITQFNSTQRVKAALSSGAVAKMVQENLDLEQHNEARIKAHIKVFPRKPSDESVDALRKALMHTRNSKVKLDEKTDDLKAQRNIARALDREKDVKATVVMLFGKEEAATMRQPGRSGDDSWLYVPSPLDDKVDRDLSPKELQGQLAASLSKEKAVKLKIQQHMHVSSPSIESKKVHELPNLTTGNTKETDGSSTTTNTSSATAYASAELPTQHAYINMTTHDNVTMAVW